VINRVALDALHRFESCGHPEPTPTNAMDMIKRITITDNDTGLLYFAELSRGYGDHTIGVTSGKFYASPSFWDMENALHNDADDLLYPSAQAAKAIEEAIEKLEAMVPASKD